MDIRKVKKLIELLDETGVAEIEIKEGEESVRISRNPSGATFAMMPQHMMYGPPPAPAAAPAAAAVTPAAAAAAVAAAAAATADQTVTAPMVGTFYSAQAPGAKPFVDIGSEVKSGDVLCIIEAMKLMNEIEADQDGEVAAIYPANAQAVEFGEKLFALKV